MADDAAAWDVCRRLQQLLHPPAGAAPADADADASAGVHAAPPSSSGSFRALKGGPVLMDDLNRVALHPSDLGVPGKNLIQGVFRETENDDFSLMSDKDAAKMRRQADKAEKAARAVFESHRAAVETALAGHAVEVVRNAVGPAVRDLHLRGICVSNGGADLIADADVVLALGRRYGLVGRNGTGKTTLLRALAARQLPGLPSNCQASAGRHCCVEEWGGCCC